MTERLPATPEGVSRAAQLLRDGGIVAFPTDTVYGVGVAAARPDLLREVYPGVPLRRAVSGRETLLSIERARGLLGYEPEHSWREAA